MAARQGAAASQWHLSSRRGGRPADAAYPIEVPAEPESLVVTVDTGDRIHFLDWGEPVAAAAEGMVAGAVGPAICLVHGLAATAWSWAPVARRLAAWHRVITPDLRGHGLSDAPRSGYDRESLAFDLLTVLVASGVGGEGDALGVARPAIVAGHGFGALVAAGMADLRPTTVLGLGFVDGGWEDAGEATGESAEELLRGLADPPEVLSSMAAYLADRRDYDPASWDADQERAARSAVDEKHAGHVAPVARSHVLRACVETMFAYQPRELLPELPMPILLCAAESGAADDELARERSLALDEIAALRRASGHTDDRLVRFPGSGHNLMRYRPVELAAELAALVDRCGEA
jgi:pimeloyl-ACP methyl ester carboxylesterase